MGVVAFAVPTCGIAVGILALAGFATAGAAIPILLGGFALFGVVSAYARKRGHLNNYLHKEENKKIDETQKQLLLPDSSSLKGIQTAADKEIAQEKLWRQHDKAIKEFCTELYKKEDLTNPASIKVAVSQAIKNNPKAFAAFKEKYEARMQERFEKLDEGKMREDFFKKVLEKKFFSKLREKKIQEIARMSATVLVETGFNSERITAQSDKERTTQYAEKSKIAAKVHQNFKGDDPITKEETGYLVDQILIDGQLISTGELHQMFKEGGGKTSVKITDSLMAIKASGTCLKDMSLGRRSNTHSQPMHLLKITEGSLDFQCLHQRVQ